MDLNLTLIVTLDKGVAVFTNKEYREEELVGKYLENTPNKLGRKISDELWESDILGRFCNHSEHPNTSLVKTETGYAVEFKLGIPRGTHISPSFVNKDYKKFGKAICEY